MSPLSPDWALRRLLAELENLEREDFEAILEGLEPAQRERVEALRSQQIGRAPASTPAFGRALKLLPPWLADRIDPREVSDEGKAGWLARFSPPRRTSAPFNMTPLALRALRSSAASVLSEPETAPTPGGRATSTWLSRRRRSAPSFFLSDEGPLG